MHALALALVTTAVASGAAVGAAATPARPASAAARGSACHSAVRRGVLPVWARAGFSGRRPRAPHVMGRGHAIVAILFGDPLYAPPAKNRGNKILWVARRHDQPLGDLRIRAQRMQGTRRRGKAVVRVVTGGPGPSLIDLPASGCWRLHLRWAGREDRLDLDYVRPPRRASGPA